MLKNFLILLIFVSVSYCTTFITFNGSQNNLWNNANNWVDQNSQNRLPNATDQVNIARQCVVQGVYTVEQITLSNGARLFIQDSGSSLTASGDTTTAGSTSGTTYIYISNGASLIFNDYWSMGGTVQFENYGTCNMNALFLSPSLSNAGSNNVIFKGNKAIQVNGDTSIPDGFRFEQVAQTINGNGVGPNRVLNINYLETIVGSWTFNYQAGSPDISFNNGLVINGAIYEIGISTTWVFLTGNVTISSNQNWNITMYLLGVTDFSGSGILTVTDKGVVVPNGATITGTGQVQFVQNLAQTLGLSITSGLSIYNKNFVFLGNWIFSGAQLTYAVSVTVTQNYTANGINVYFPAGTTLDTSSSKLSLSGGTWNFQDSLIVTGTSSTFDMVVSPVFSCSFPSKTFSLTGGNQILFSGGLTVNGCILSSANNFQIRNTFSTNNGNSTIPTNGDFTTNIQFSSNNNNLYSTTILGGRTFTSSLSVQINNEVIFTSPLTLNNGAFFDGSGMVTVAANSVTFGTNNTIIPRLSFYSGTVTLSSSSEVIVSSLYLRNTLLTGTADINFSGGSIWVTEGFSSINMANFRFKSTVNVVQQTDGIGQRTSSQLDINGATNRYFDNNFNAEDYVNVVFRDATTLNGTVSFTSVQNPSQLSSLTFMQTSLTLSGGYNVAFSGNLYFNSSVNLLGQGQVSFSSNSRVFLSGNLNPDGTSNLVSVVFNTVSLYVLNNLSIGSNVALKASTTLYDNDQLSTTATTLLTLQGTRTINFAFTLGANVLIGGNLYLSSGASFTNSAGYLQVSGSQVFLSTSLTIRNQVNFANPTTLQVFNGANQYTLTLTDVNTNFVSHQVNLPTLTIGNNVNLVVNTGSGRDFVNVAFGGNIGGTGSLSLNNIIGTTTTTTTINCGGLSLTSVTLSSGTYNLNPIGGLLVINNYVIATGATANVNVPIVNANSQTVIAGGVVFLSNPTTFDNAPISFQTPRTVSVTYIANTALTFANDVQINSQITGNGLITFLAGVTLGSSQTINNPVNFGVSSTSLTVVSGTTFTLTLTGTTINVFGSVVSGGASIVSTSPTSGLQTITGGGSITSDWTWTNTIRFGNLNITGNRAITVPLQLTSNSITVFPNGVVISGQGAFLAEPNLVDATLQIETSFTNNVPGLVVPQGVYVRITGQLQTFQFTGSNLYINGTFKCETPINFATSVTFGITTTSSNFEMGNGCYFLGSSQTITINRAGVDFTSSTGAQSPLYVEPAINFALTNPSTFSTVTFSASGSDSLLFKGNFNIYGTGVSFNNNNLQLGAITVTSYQNNTFSNINPTATLTFVSTTSPWVEPTVSISGALSTVFVLNGPIRMVNPSISRSGNFVGSNRVAFVNSLSLSSSNSFYNFLAPVQFYTTTITNFGFSLGSTNTLTFTQVPSTFNPLALPPVSISTSGSNSILRFLFTGSLSIGNVDITSTTTLRLSSGVTISALFVTVRDNAYLWVDGATATCENLLFNTLSTLRYTISSGSPLTISVTKYAFYQGSLILDVNNFVFSSGSITAVTAASANQGGLFTSVTGTSGYVFVQTRQGNNIVLSSSLAPTSSAYPTPSTGPIPIVSSASMYLINFALLISVLFFLF